MHTYKRLIVIGVVSIVDIEPGGNAFSFGGITTRKRIPMRTAVIKNGGEGI